jgi:hypothetical protein
MHAGHGRWTGPRSENRSAVAPAQGRYAFRASTPAHRVSRSRHWPARRSGDRIWRRADGASRSVPHPRIGRWDSVFQPSDVSFVLFSSAITLGGDWKHRFRGRVRSIVSSIGALDVGSATRVPADHERGGAGRLSGTTPEVRRPVSKPSPVGPPPTRVGAASGCARRTAGAVSGGVRNTHTVAEFACGTIGGM